jgi:hypothetical protein
MKKIKVPPETTEVWITTKGTWPTRTELQIDLSPGAANSFANSLSKSGRKVYVAKAYLIQLDDKWYRVNATPIPLECKLPKKMRNESFDVGFKKPTIEKPKVNCSPYNPSQPLKPLPTTYFTYSIQVFKNLLKKFK